MKKQIINEPKFVKQFQCVGGECIDSCCSGWRIMLDKRSVKRYLKGNNIIIKNIAVDNISVPKIDPQNWGMMKLNGQGDCAFLDEKKLCKVQQELGASALSVTCANYPRIDRAFRKEVNKSLQLSCPEVTRLVLTDPYSMQMDEREVILQSLPVAPELNQKNKLINLMCRLLIQQAGSETNEALYAIAMLFLAAEKTDLESNEGLSRLENVFSDLITMLSEGSVAKKLEQIEADRQLQWSMLLLIQVHLESRPVTRALHALRHYVKQLIFVQTRHIDQNDMNVPMSELEKAWQENVLPWLRQRPHMMTNFMQYRIYHDNFPEYKNRSSLACLYLMTAEWFLLKMLMCAQFVVNGTITEEDIINIIYSYHTITKHNLDTQEAFFAKIDKVKVGDDLSLLHLLN